MKRFLSFLLLIPTLANAHGFLAGTPVKTPQGYTQIQSLGAGDAIISCDELMRCVDDEVRAVYKDPADGYLELSIGNEIIKASATQAFYSASKDEWVMAKDLNPSDVLVRSTGQTQSLKTIRWVQKETSLFNLSVAKHHNYYVGESEVLVHNIVFLIPMIPILAWGGGAGIAVGIGAGTAATLAATAATVAVGVGVGIAIDQAGKYSNSPVSVQDTLPTGPFFGIPNSDWTRFGIAILTAAAEGHKAAQQTNPFAGPVSETVNTVDSKGNNIRVEPGERIYPSPRGDFTVKDQNGRETGSLHQGHPNVKHPKPEGQVPHAHRPGYKNENGDVWLPVNH